MKNFIIRFTEEKDSTEDYVAYIQSIYKDILRNRIEDSYEVCMGGPFLRSEAERIIGQLHEAIIEACSNYVDVRPEGIVIAGGSFDVSDPYLVELTYHFTHSSL